MPSKLEILRRLALRQKGAYGAQRVERAADEIKNLTKLYSPKALEAAFIGDNAKALMTMNPKDFERYATPLASRTPTDINKIDPDIVKRYGDKMRMTTEDYLKELQRVKGGFADVPYLEINKGEQGSAMTPYISGHEGRHRNRSMADAGEQAGLIRLEPRAELREPFPRLTQEEYIEALRQELGMTGNKVQPQSDWQGNTPIFRDEIDLPPIYKQGGEVSQDAMRMAVMNQKVQHKAKGGIEAAKALLDIARGTRSRAAQEAAGLYHPIGGGVKLNTPVPLMDFKTIKDPDVKMAPLKIITPESLYKGRGIPLVGDRALAGRIVTEIGGKDVNVVGEGGPNYIRTHSNKDPAISASWASGDMRTTNLAEEAGKAGDPVYGINVIGSPTNVDFNTMVTKAILDQYDPSAVTNANKKAFTKALKTYVPDASKPHMIPGANFVGMDDVDALREQLMAAGAGNLRKAFVDRLNTAKFNNMGFPDVAQSRLATTEPALVDSPIGMAGFTVAKMDPSGRIIESPVREHTTYPVAAGGKYYGSLDEPVNYQDIFQRFGQYRRAMGANPASDYRSFSLSPQIQDFDQEWLDTIMKTMGKDRPSVGEYKDGGAVHMAGGSLVDDLINDAKKNAPPVARRYISPVTGENAPRLAPREGSDKPYEGRSTLFPEGIMRDVAEASYRDIGPSIVPAERGWEPSITIGRQPSHVAAPVDVGTALTEAGSATDYLSQLSGEAALRATGSPLLATAAAYGLGMIGPEKYVKGAKALGNEAAYRIYQAMTTGEGPLAGALASVAPRQLITYHGTPHRMAPTKKNPLGEFDSTKIGTGQGAQTYGEGHYLAEVPDVAKIYQPRDLAHEEELLKLYNAAATRGDFLAMEILENSLMHKTPTELRDIHGKAGEPVIRQIDKIPRTVGALYGVDLPDEHIANMIDYDKPINEQTPQVKALLEKAGINIQSSAQAGTMIGGQERNLAKHGIPGLKYYDEKSRYLAGWEVGKSGDGTWMLKNNNLSADQWKEFPTKEKATAAYNAMPDAGTRNFVVFPGNENMTNIISREKEGGVIHKVEGGEVTSDDLILEERPL